MNPFLLRDTLTELASQLPAEDEEAEPHDLLEAVSFCMETQLGLEQRLYRIEGADELPPPLKNLHEVLCYLQALTHFLNAITFDGLFSVFYNDSGQDIAELRRCLKRHDTALSTLFEAAYALVAPRLAIPWDSNFCTDHRGADPYEEIDATTFAAFEQIENTIDDHWDSYFENAEMVYNSLERQP
jgi:hypothetical protein